ncbi:hypothetical protein QJS10_CPA07g00477 [Acorus calamus]|uniref:Uncharacterized protein n=1 Tax=Acorus calamus TaxID=4465 RepID=A0AAV9EGK7_ACOCL|nr:hypothetical protein QJS10_CPA07g00477 [Acorus calamus]
MNKALLTKWVWKWLEGNNSVWIMVMKARYGGTGIGEKRWPTLNARTSSLCKGIFLDMLEVCRAFGWELGSGATIQFWIDRWCGEEMLGDVAPDLFRLSCNKEGGVDKFFQSRENGGGWTVALTRARLGEVEARQFENLMTLLDHFVVRPEQEDHIRWRPTMTGAYLVKGGYRWWWERTAILNSNRCGAQRFWDGVGQQTGLSTSFRNIEELWQSGKAMDRSASDREARAWSQAIVPAGIRVYHENMWDSFGAALRDWTRFIGRDGVALVMSGSIMGMP